MIRNAGKLKIWESPVWEGRFPSSAAGSAFICSCVRPFASRWRSENVLDVFPDEPWGCGREDAASWSRVGSAAPADSLQEENSSHSQG